MYNIFKRPMFKLGGQADQGSGIMSTVEPKQTMRQNPYTGYAIGGRIMAQEGYNPFTMFAPSNIPKAGFATSQSDENSGLNLLREAQEKFDTEQRAIQLSNRQNLGITSPQIKKGFGFLESDAQKLLRERGFTNQLSAADRVKIEKGLKAARETEEKINLYGPSEDIPTKNIITSASLPPPPSDFKKRTYEKPTQLSLKEQIAKESQEIRDLLKDEDYTKGEAALILSEVLANPEANTIAKKISLASKLARPVARAQKEEDKAITLAAYKLAKEKEQYQMRFGADPDEIKKIRLFADTKARKENRDPNEVFDELILQTSEGKTRYDPIQAEGLKTLLGEKGVGEFRKSVNEIIELRNKKQKAINDKKDTKQIDIELQEAEEKFKTFKAIPGFDLAYGEYKNFKIGGRVMKQGGGDIEEVEDAGMISSKVSFDNKSQDATTIEKPVEKLSYTQLRDRLPQEITNDVVMLIANSEEALQDFAYIRTQSDVGKFNVKYGVNLIIPPAAG